MKLIFVSILGLIFSLSVVNFSLAGEIRPSIKIVYEIDSEIEAKINLVGKDKNSDWDILTESSKYNEFRYAQDLKSITKGLNEELTSIFRKKGYLIKSEDTTYVLTFLVEEISYDDFKGMPYLRRVFYKLSKGNNVIYQATFNTQKKEFLFGKGEYTELLKTKKVAIKIAEDLYKKIDKK